MEKVKPLAIHVSPSVSEAEKIMVDAVSKRKAVIIIGNFWVDYHGRAKSTLDAGERVLLLKEDGSLLVHRSIGSEPVNWQPPGCRFRIRKIQNQLEICAFRRNPSESVHVFFDRIFMISVLNLVDHGEFALYASEKDMQKAILLNPSLLEEGFQPIRYEKQVKPGFIDLFGIDKNGKLVVVEIKRKTAGREAVLQLTKYIDTMKKKADRDIRGILVAPKIANKVQVLLETLGLEFKCIDPKKCAELIHRSKTRKLADFFPL